MWKKIKPYVISILIALAVGGLSALVTKGNMDIYDQIVKPKLAPPGFIFPIVWSILFVLMGISSALVYVKAKEDTAIQKTGLGVYALQLIVNFFWSVLFFNFQAFLLSFLWLILLWILILIMIVRSYRISPLAAYLQIPYLVWVTFAAYLNFAIFLLSR
jgi:tryptophan-rich sensory protein